MSAAHTSHASDGDPLPAQNQLLLFGNPTNIAGKGNFVIKNSVPLLNNSVAIRCFTAVAFGTEALGKPSNPVLIHWSRSGRVIKNYGISPDNSVSASDNRILGRKYIYRETPRISYARYPSFDHLAYPFGN
jgi:hypothetical protein